MLWETSGICLSLREVVSKVVCCKHSTTVEMVNVASKRCLCWQGQLSFGKAGCTWDDAIVVLVVARHVATEKSVMGNEPDMPIVSAKWLARLCVANIIRLLE